MRHHIRTMTASVVVAIYVLPILWWGMSAFTPADAMLDLRRVLTFDFTPTLDNFALTMLGAGGTIFDSRQSLVDSVIVALLSTVIVLFAATPMAYALSTFTFRHRSRWLKAVLLQRFMPPIAIIFPLVVLFHGVGFARHTVGRGAGPFRTELAFRHPVAEILL